MNKLKNVKAYFKDKNLIGKSRQYIIVKIEDCGICADQKVFSEDPMAMYFINVLEEAAREYFILHTNKRHDPQRDVRCMVNHCHLSSAQLKLQAEAGRMSLIVYMKRNDTACRREDLKGYIEYINRIVPRLPEGFNQPIHKKDAFALAL